MVLRNDVHLVALPGALCAVAAVGRMLATLLRLPSVIGEITLSLLLGPVLLGAAGPVVFAAVLPQDLVALLAMALVTTALTGPLPDLIDHRTARRKLRPRQEVSTR
jgi:hypothetical protein